MNDIDKLDGMIKIKGKCGYEFIGGCKELRKYKQVLKEIRIISRNWTSKLMNDGYCEILDKIDEVLNDRD